MKTADKHLPVCDAKTVGSGNDEEELLWKTLHHELLAECKVFTVSTIRAESLGADRKKATFHTLQCSPWVNIIALDIDTNVIMVQQFRHGVSGLTLEIPGGCVDPNDADPLAGAIRELREETGCVADRWTYLGKTHPNPALQDNLCFTYLAEGVTQIEAPRFDETGTERIKSVLLPLAEITETIRRGEISHALVITAFHFLSLARPDLH